MNWQRGHVRLEGRSWRLYYRAPAGPGSSRRQVSTRLGTVHELPTKAAARRAADRFLEGSSPRQVHGGTVIPWPTWCQIYGARYLVLLGRGSRATRESIIRRHLVNAPSLAGLAVHEIDVAACQAFILDQHATGAAASTTRTRFALLRRMLRTAFEAGLAVDPPRADRLRFPRDESPPHNIRSKAFNETEVAAILAHAPEPLGTVCALARFAGLRVGETLGLTWESVNLANGRLEVRQQAQDGAIRPLKTRSSAATLRAPLPLLARLRRYRETWDPNPAGLLFASPDGRPLDAAALRHELHELLARLGIARKGFHAFRHACALAMARAGVNPEALRRAMRHASLRNTAVYLSATPEDIAAALEAASNVDGEAMGTGTRPAREIAAFPSTDADPQTSKSFGSSKR